MRLLSLVTTMMGMVVLAAAQCALCRAAIRSSDAVGFVQGLRSGILLLLLMPYLIVGTIAFAIYRAYRRQRSDRTIV